MTRLNFYPKLILCFLFLLTGTAWGVATEPYTPNATPSALKPQSDFMDEFPNLKKHLYNEPDTNIRLGVGISPILIMRDKAGFSANIFEVHWMKHPWDWLVFSASYGTTLSGEPLSKINAFTFRTVPKFKLSRILSAGVVFGYELVSFPDVNSKIYKGTLFSKDFEPFSNSGWIYGAALSETLPLSGKFSLKLNQLLYKQTYDPEGTYNGWLFYYENDALNKSKDQIAPGIVFLLEISLIY